MAKNNRISTYHLPLASVPKGRYALANPEIAAVESKKALTRAINRSKGKNVPINKARISGEGKALKKGVVAFAQRAGMSPQMVRELQSMSEAKLLQLYDENDILFESYFDYGGIEGSVAEGFQLPEVVKEKKRADFQRLIDQYGKRFGA